uniref:Uncharacterized protein n=1 Tax=Helianthus annuus TaxID=4232 RepID=A0A251SX52_HELAN
MKVIISTCFVISFPVDAVTDTYGTFLPDGTAFQFQQILSLSVLEDSRITSCDTSSPGGDSNGAASESQYTKEDVLTRA